MVDAIRKLCTDKGITLAELEQKAGLPKNTIFRWDTNRPNVIAAVRVARELGVTVEDLVRKEAS